MIGKGEGLIKMTYLQYDDTQKSHHKYVQRESNQADGLTGERENNI